MWYLSLLGALGSCLGLSIPMCWVYFCPSVVSLMPVTALWGVSWWTPPWWQQVQVTVVASGSGLCVLLAPPSAFHVMIWPVTFVSVLVYGRYFYFLEEGER